VQTIQTMHIVLAILFRAYCNHCTSVCKCQIGNVTTDWNCVTVQYLRFVILTVLLLTSKVCKMTNSEDVSNVPPTSVLRNVTFQFHHKSLSVPECQVVERSGSMMTKLSDCSEYKPRNVDIRSISCVPCSLS